MTDADDQTVTISRDIGVPWRADPSIMARLPEVERLHLASWTTQRIADELRTTEPTVRRDLARRSRLTASCTQPAPDPSWPLVACGRCGCWRVGHGGPASRPGHTFQARFGTTWAPTGRRPVLRRLSQRREVSSSVALQAPLDGPARLYARHFRGSMHGEQVIAALRYFRRQIGRPLLVIWDRLQAHRARPVQDFQAARPADYHVEWLPFYAPELNPKELCTGWVKRDLQNAVPASVDELHHFACRSFRRLGRHADLLLGFFRHAGLSVTGFW
jgi:transposase